MTLSRFVPLLRVTCLGLVAPGLLAAPLHAATLPAADIFSTSFEATETPTYTIGTLGDSQNGWLIGTNKNAASNMIVAPDRGDLPAAPDGLQMLRHANTLNTGAPINSLVFTNAPLEDSFHFSGLTAFSGTPSADTTVISRFYLNRNDATYQFGGIHFGIMQDAGELRFFYMAEKSPGVRDIVALGDSLAQADTFYRFEVDVDIPHQRYSIRVYHNATNALLADADDGRFRTNGLSSINYLRLSGVGAGPTPNLEVYYDQLWISTTAIPESGSLALSSLLLLGFAAKFKKLSTPNTL